MVFAAILFAVIAALFIAACGEDDPPPDTQGSDPSVTVPEDPPDDGDPSDDDPAEDPELATISYVFADADGNELASGTVTEGSGIETAPEPPDIEHYDFVSWSVDGVRIDLPYVPDEDCIIVPEYSVRVYTYSFEDEGTDIPHISAADALTEVSGREPAGVAHREFIGWYVGDEKAVFPYVLTGDVTFTAVYETCVYEYSFVRGGETLSYGSAEALTELTAPSAEREHYVFDGWYANGEKVSFPYTLTGDTVFTASYTAIKYEVTYQLGGGKNAGSNPVWYDMDSLPTVLNAPTYTCRTFEGWFTDEDLTERVTELPVVGGDITLWAKWSEPVHSFDTAHVCIACGENAEISSHDYYGTHECVICGHEADEHSYDGGVCTMCGETCVHAFGIDHVCSVCGMSAEKTDHVFDTSHICGICGYATDSAHIYGSDHNCTICGAAHSEHIYDEEHCCTVCGFADPVREHIYEDGVCAICGDSLAWDGSVAESFASGSGSLSDPYVIKTAGQLAYLAKIVNEGSDIADGHFILASDIYLDGREWTPIGSGYTTTDAVFADSAFSGTFDGMGHTIYGLRITEYAATEDTGSGRAYSSVGLFGAVMGDGENASVRNLMISGYEIDISSSENKLFVSAGGLAGVVVRTDIYGCAADGGISINLGSTGSARVGGLIGGIDDSNRYGSVSCCTADVEIYAVCGDTLRIGGLTGETSFGKITHCVASSVLYGRAGSVFAAGLTGGTKTKVNECYSETAADIPDGSSFDAFATGADAYNCFCGEDSTMNGLSVGSPYADGAGDVTAALGEWTDHGLTVKNGAAVPDAFAGTAADTHAHVYGEDHLCAVCGKAHENSGHVYASGACVVCGCEHSEHSYDVGHVCTVCGVSYPSSSHVYSEDGICSVCYHECTHVYSGSHTCTECGKTAAAHDYDAETGKCVMCGAECEHDYGGDHACDKCGFAVSEHTYDPATGVCTLCGAECSHAFVGSHTCETCGFTAPGHVYDGSTGECTMCGEVCDHVYDVSHACAVCGMTHVITDHLYDGGECTICSFVHADHEYNVSHVCAVCGMTHVITDHLYDGGSCRICGHIHEGHVFDTSHKCEVCGYPHAAKDHTYSDGACTICAFEHTDHEYDGSHLCDICGHIAPRHIYDASTGKCVMCAAECEHDFDTAHDCRICGMAHAERDHAYMNGTCTICGYGHTGHEYDESHICTVCGKSYGSAGHIYRNGVCAVCGYAHTDHDYGTEHKCGTCGITHEVTFHVWQSGFCYICGIAHSPHDYDTEHICKICNAAHERTRHDYENGMCTICGDIHTVHVYDTSHVCTKCGMVYHTTTHLYADGKCTVCNYEHSDHRYNTSHLCDVCGKAHVTLTHEYSDGVCTICNDEHVDHEYDETHSCSICGHSCETKDHIYSGSHVCTICGYTISEHAYDPATGICTMCGEECAHKYEKSHICTICGHTATAHAYDPATGACTMCGEECGHEYENSHICTICGFAASAHTYDPATGACTMCGEECGHDYEDSHVCTVCGYSHEVIEHVYSYGVCTICGHEHTGHIFDVLHICVVCGYVHPSSEHTGDGTCSICGESMGWDGTVADGFAGGSGTETDPYLITNAAELAYLAKFTAEGGAAYGVYFALTEDIDLGGREWTPIGSGHYTSDGVQTTGAFAGVFDGRGHKVTGLSITTATYERDGNTGRDHASVGLFGAVCGVRDSEGKKLAAIKDLIVEDYEIILETDDPDTMISAGGLAGLLHVASVTGCDVSGVINIVTAGNADVGGIAGTIYDDLKLGSVSGCASDVDISVEAGEMLYAGGVVGMAKYGNVNDSEGVSVVTASAERVYAAGVVADNGDGKTQADGNYAFVTLTVTADRTYCDAYMYGSTRVTDGTYSSASVLNGEKLGSSSGANAVS